MCPAIVCGMVTRDAPTSYWSYFFSVPAVFAKVKLDPVFFLYIVSKEANCS